MARRRRNREADSILLRIRSDLHCGSSLGLCTPEPIELDDGQELRPSKVQNWMWQCHQTFLERSERVREEWDAQLYDLYNGDMVDGPDHHGTVQVMSRHPGIEKVIAKRCLEESKAQGPDRTFVVRGTEVHVGKSGSSEDSLAEWLGAEKDPETGANSWWHLRLELQGLRIDATHHGKMGMLPWTAGAAVARYAMQIFTEHAVAGDPAPHLAIRSHYHRHYDSGSLAPTRVIQTPAFQAKTAFVHRIAADSIADVGGVLVLIRDGRIADVETIKFKPSRGAVWRQSS